MRLDLPSVRVWVLLVLQWTVVPIFMVSVVLLARSVRRRAAGREHQLSAAAGFWAGAITMLIVTVRYGADASLPHAASGLSIRWEDVLIGLLVGFGTLLVVRFLAPTRLVGLVVFFLSAAGFVSLFAYLFLPLWQSLLASMTLGAALGALSHVMFFPSGLANLGVTND